MIYVSIPFKFVTLPSRLALFSLIFEAICMHFILTSMYLASSACCLKALANIGAGRAGEAGVKGAGRKFAVNFQEFEKRQVHLN